MFFIIIFSLLGVSAYHWFRFAETDPNATDQRPSKFASAAKAIVVTIAAAIAGANGTLPEPTDHFLSVLALGLLASPIFNTLNGNNQGHSKNIRKKVLNKIGAGAIIKIFLFVFGALFFWAHYIIWLGAFIAFITILNTGKALTAIILAESNDGPFSGLTDLAKKAKVSELKNYSIAGILGANISLLCAGRLIIPESDLSPSNFMAWGGLVAAKILEAMTEIVA